MFKIMAIDPGSYHIGVCLMDLNDKLELIGIETISVEIGNIIPHISNNDIISRCHNFNVGINDILKYSNPTIVAIESSFINKLRPTSVIPLSKILGVLTSSIYGFNKDIKVIDISPMEGKKAINMGNTVSRENSKDKDFIKRMVYSNVEIAPLIGNIYINEHELDAVAVGYGLLRLIRNNPAILITY